MSVPPTPSAVQTRPARAGPAVRAAALPGRSGGRATWAFTSSAGVLLVRVVLGLRPGLLDDGSPLAAELEGAVALEAARSGCILEECRVGEGRVTLVADVPLNLALTALVARVKRGAERRLRRRWPALPDRSLFERGFLVGSLDPQAPPPR